MRLRAVAIVIAFAIIAGGVGAAQVIRTSGSKTVTTTRTQIVTSLPSNISPPTISRTAPGKVGASPPGNPVIGDVLYAGTGTWSGSPTGFAYQWDDCDSSGANCFAAAGSPNNVQRYQIVSGDAGSTLRVAVTASYSGHPDSTVMSQPTGLVASNGSTAGCFSALGACGFPDPSATYSGASAPASDWNTGGTGVGLNPNTDSPAGTAGVAGCASLATQHSGNVSTSSNLSNENIVNGQLTITANNVTINNVCVTFSHQAMNGPSSSAAVYLNGHTGVTIENSIIAGVSATGTSGLEIALSSPGTGATLQHDYIYRCGECIHDSPWTVTDSYVNDNGDYGVGEHQEDYYGTDLTATFTHNTLLTDIDTTDSPTQESELIGDTNGGSGGPCDNTWIITNNLLAGAGLILSPCANATSVGTSSMIFTGNHIARCITPPLHQDSGSGSWDCGTTYNAGQDAFGYWPGGGYFQVGNDTGNPIYCGDTGWTWTGDVWDDNGASTGCPASGFDAPGEQACGCGTPGLPPFNSVAPTISGTASVGDVLTAGTGTWSGSPTYTYQWSDCNTSGLACVPISGATSSTYTLQVGDEGNTIVLAVTGTNSYGPETATSAATSTVGSSFATSACFNASSDSSSAKPSVCGLPDPNSTWTSATGVGPNNGTSAVACTSLATQHTGNVSTSTNLSNENIIGTLAISGTNTVVNNVCVNDPTDNDSENAVTMSGTNDLLENSTVWGPKASCTPSGAACASGVQEAVEGNGTLEHDYLSFCDECIHDGPWTVDDSYIYQNTDFSGDEQEDYYGADQTLTIDHSVLLAAPGQNTEIAVIFGDSNGGLGGPCDNQFTITNSLLGGQSYITEPCANATGVGTSDIDFENDNIATCSSNAGTSCSANAHGYYQTGGASNIMTHCYNPGLTWTTNIWDFGAGAISKPTGSCSS